MVDKQRLLEPFDPSCIKQRPGVGRSVFDYVPGGDVIARIIEASDNEFEWTVVSLELVTTDDKPYWVIRGSLSVPGLGSRDGVGTHPAEGVDAAKAAETDALKRAAVKFGVALHLYTDEVNGVAKPASPAKAPTQPSPRNGSNGRRHDNADNGIGPCPECHAPAGKPHASRCRLVSSGR